jgi:hypothetical protein
MKQAVESNGLRYLLKDPGHTQEKIAIWTSVVVILIYLSSTSVVMLAFYMLKGVHPWHQSS